MKIDIEQNSAYEETAVTIRCAGLSREVMELLAQDVTDANAYVRMAELGNALGQ